MNPIEPIMTLSAKEIKQNMTQGEFEIGTFHDNNIYIKGQRINNWEVISCNVGDTNCNPDKEPFIITDENSQANAQAIVNALNNTYGKNIAPEACIDLLEALKACMKRLVYLDNENRNMPESIEEKLMAQKAIQKAIIQ